ncbi:MAG: hypothetical protein RL754_1415 [Bacteroidota bacterium]|jgi:membrane protease YdiL (CAAX protease family)
MAYTDKTLLWGKARTSLYFGLITVLSVSFFGGIGYQFSSTQFGITSPTGMRWLQFSISLGLFLMPPLFLAQFASNQPLTFLGIRKLPTFLSASYARKNAKPLPPTYFTYIALFLISFGGFFAIDLLAHLNYGLARFDWAQSFVEQEEQMAALTATFLSNMTPAVLLANFLVMVLLPAVGEEFFFRGVVQKLLQRSLAYPVAVLFTALFFALVHQQPLSMLPIFFMGLIFGYVKIWTGSLWAPVLLHLINNAYALLSVYITGEMQAASELAYNPWGLFGLIPLIIGLRWMRSINHQHTAWLRQ